MKRITYNIIYFVLFVGILLQSCSKQQELGVNPYDGGKQPLGIVFTSYKAYPESGRPGEIISLNVKGLAKYENQFKLLLNDVETEIVNLSDSIVDIRIPQEVSSGIVTVLLDGQIFYGPRVGVEGKAAVDTDYKIVNGFNSTVTQILPNSGGHIIVGSFTDFEGQATPSNIINSIHFINTLGQTSTGMDFRRSATGGITSIAKLPNGQFMIAGNLTAFSKREVGRIARLHANGNLDTTVVSVINPDSEKKPLNGFDTVSTFNGGLNGSVRKVFATEDNGVIAIGTFTNHYKIDYDYSSRENRRLIYTKVNNIAKMKNDGSLDSTYNMNNVGFNGYINDAVQLNDGRIVVVGSFTSYNGKAARNIACIKTNGQLDETFAPQGADKEILSVTYNSTTNKLAIAGNFKQYAGASTNGVVLLNNNGTVDQTFKFGQLDDEGIASFAYSLNNGRVFVSGGFTKYNNVRRGNMLILETNGVAKQEYNNLGSFGGSPFSIVETTSSLGNPAILLAGLIISVDGKSTGNIVRIELKN